MERKNTSFIHSRIADIFEDENDNEKVLVTEDWRRHLPEVGNYIAYERNDDMKCGDESMPLSDEELESSEIRKENREKIRQQYLKSQSSDDSFSGRISPIQNHDIFPVVKGIDENFIREGVHEELESTLRRIDNKRKDYLKFRNDSHKACPVSHYCWSTQTKSSSNSFGIISNQDESGKRPFYKESVNLGTIEDDKCHAMEEARKLIDIRGNNVAEKKFSSYFTADIQERFGFINRKVIEPLHPYQQTKKMFSYMEQNEMKYLEQDMAERAITKEIGKIDGSNALCDIHSEEIKNTLHINDKKHGFSNQRETLSSFWWLKDNSKSGSQSSIHNLAKNFKRAKEETVISDAEEAQVIKKHKTHKWDDGTNADHGILCISSKQDSENTPLRKDTSHEEGLVKLNNPKFCSNNEKSNILWSQRDYDVNKAWWKNVNRVNLPDSPYGTTNKNFEIAVKQVFWNINKINEHNWRKRNYPAENSKQFDAGERENTLSLTDANFNILKALKTDESREIQKVKEDETKGPHEEIENLSEDSIGINMVDEKNIKSFVTSHRSEMNVENGVALSKNDLELVETELSNRIQLHRRDEKEVLKCTTEHVTPPKEKMEEKVDCGIELDRKTLKKDQIKMQNFQEKSENETTKINFILINPIDKIMENPKEEVNNEEKALEKKSRSADDKEKETRRGKISLTAEEKAMSVMEIRSLVDGMITEKEKELMLGNATKVIDSKINADMIDNNQKENYIIKNDEEKSLEDQDTEMTFLEMEGKMRVEMTRKNMIERGDKVKESGDELLKENSINLLLLNDMKFYLKEQMQGAEDNENFQEEKVIGRLTVERIEKEIENNDINKKEWKAEDSDKNKGKTLERNGIVLQEIIENDEIKLAVEEKKEQTNETMCKDNKRLNDEKVGEFYEENNSHDRKIKYEGKDIKELIVRIKREIKENEVSSNEKYEEEAAYKDIISSDENREKNVKNETSDCLAFSKKTDKEEINEGGEGMGNSVKTCQTMNDIECNLQRDVIILEKNIVLSEKMKGACKNRSERVIKLEVKELTESIDDFKSMEDKNQPERSLKQSELETNIPNYILKEESGKFICENNSTLLKGFIGYVGKSDGIKLFKESKAVSAKTSNLSSALYENEALSYINNVDKDGLFNFSCGKNQENEMTSEKNEPVTLEENKIVEDEMTSSNVAKGNGLFTHDLAVAVHSGSKHLEYTGLSVDEAMDDVPTSNLSDFNGLLHLSKDSETVKSKMQLQFNVDSQKTNGSQRVVSSETNKDRNGGFHIHGKENTDFWLEDERKIKVYLDHKNGVDNLETTVSVKKIALFDMSVQNKKVFENGEEKMNFIKFSEIFGNLIKMNEVGITFININFINIRMLDTSKILTEKVFHAFAVEQNKFTPTSEKERKEMYVDDGIVEMANKRTSVHYAKLEDIIFHNMEIYDDSTYKWNASGGTETFEFNEPNEALVNRCGLNHSTRLLAQETKSYENNEELLCIEDSCDTHAIKDVTIHNQLNTDRNTSECRQRSINCENHIKIASGFDGIVPDWDEEPFETIISENNIFQFDFDSNWEDPFKITTPALNEHENCIPPQNFKSAKKQDEEEKFETVSKTMKCMPLLASITSLEEVNLIENQIYRFGDRYLPKQKLLKSPECIVDENEFNDILMDEENKYNIFTIPEKIFPSLENASSEGSTVNKDIQSSIINGAPEVSFKNKKDSSDDFIDSISLDEYLNTIIDNHCGSEKMKDHLPFDCSSDSQPLLNNVECQTELGGLTKTFHTPKCLETLLLSGNELEFCQIGGRKRNLHALNIETTLNKRLKKTHDSLCIDYLDNIFINNITDGNNDSLLRKRVESNAFDSKLQKSAVSAGCKTKETIAETVANKVLQYEEQDWENELDEEPMEDEHVDQKVPDVTNQDSLKDEETSQIWEITNVNETATAKIREIPSISNTLRSSTVLRLGLSKRAKLPHLHHVQ